MIAAEIELCLTSIGAMDRSPSMACLCGLCPIPLTPIHFYEEDSEIHVSVCMEEKVETLVEWNTTSVFTEQILHS